MTSKMAARLLNYELGSPSYGDSKFEKRKNFKKRSSSYLQAWFWLTGFFGCGKEYYHFQQELMVSKMMVKLFS